MKSHAPELPRTLGSRDLLLPKPVAIVNVSLLAPDAGLGRRALWLRVVAVLALCVVESEAAPPRWNRAPGTERT